jgi:hypothetical protein
MVLENRNWIQNSIAAGIAVNVSMTNTRFVLATFESLKATEFASAQHRQGLSVSHPINAIDKMPTQMYHLRGLSDFSRPHEVA